MGKVVEEQELLSSNIFNSKFSKNSNCRINLLFHARVFKLCHFGIFDALFLFSAFSKLESIISKFSGKNVKT